MKKHVIKESFNNIPEQIAHSYMEGHKRVWKKWSKQFLNNLSQTGSVQLAADQLYEQFGSIDIYLPKDLSIVERLYDFGKDQVGYENIHKLFHALMEKHKTHLTALNFKNLVRKLHNATAFPKTELERYGHHESAPSKELQSRLQKVWGDLEKEKRILTLSEIPDDPDEIVYILKKFAKDQMGPPENWPTFLEEVVEKFRGSEDWDDIQKAIEKLKKKEPDWSSRQTYFTTR